VAVKNYVVEGMTCGHCVSAVQSEVSAVTGVTGVEVELESGRLVVEGSGFSDDDISAAVDEAGYALAGR
jgi:copper chaperone CopZ